MPMTTVPMMRIKQSQFEHLLAKERKYDAVVKERDDLWEKLKELHITIRQRDDAEIGVLLEYVSPGEFVTLRSRFQKAYAVTESLLIDHEKREDK